MKTNQKSTVEPVFGTLNQFMDMRKVNTIGIKQANKVMLMAAAAYNIKKHLKFTQKLTALMSKVAELAALYVKAKFSVFSRLHVQPKILISN